MLVHCLHWNAETLPWPPKFSKGLLEFVAATLILRRPSAVILTTMLISCLSLIDVFDLVDVLDLLDGLDLLD